MDAAAVRKRILKNSIIIGLVAVTGSLYLENLRITLAIAVAAAAMSTNFWLLCKVIEGVLSFDKELPRWKLWLRLVAKVVFIFGALGLLMFKADMEPLALLAGVSNVVLAIFLEAVLPEPKESG